MVPDEPYDFFVHHNTRCARGQHECHTNKYVLKLDPSSTCDICLEEFNSPDKDCLCTPCGHLFCRSCLRRLAQPQCPLCREDLYDRYLLSYPLRKLHVDLSNSQNASKKVQEAKSDIVQQARRLEHRLASELHTNAGHLEPSRIADLRAEITSFITKHSYLDSSLVSLKALLGQLHATMLRREQEAEESRAAVEAYEARIDHLERQLAGSRGRLRRGSPVVLKDHFETYTPAVNFPSTDDYPIRIRVRNAAHAERGAYVQAMRPPSPPAQIELLHASHWIVHPPERIPRRTIHRYY